jgi:hypothetical protein
VTQAATQIPFGSDEARHRRRFPVARQLTPHHNKIFANLRWDMRSAIVGVVVLVLVQGCASPGSSPRSDLAVAGSDARPLSLSDFLFPDRPPGERAPADLERSDAGFSSSIAVSSSQVLAWKSACSALPVESPVLAPGSYLVTLTASNLSKGSSQQDDYLLIGLPIAAGEPAESIRYFVLNGLGSKRSFTLASAGVVRAWFLDSDRLHNSGTATATITPGVHPLTVDAKENVIAWLEDCKSVPAELEVPAGSHRLTLTESSFSSAPGFTDPHVLLRLPLEGDPRSTSRSTGSAATRWSCSPPPGSCAPG